MRDVRGASCPGVTQRADVFMEFAETLSEIDSIARSLSRVRSEKFVAAF